MKLFRPCSILIILFANFAWAGKPEAEKIALSAPACKSIQPFYWEIGDATSVQAASSIGSKYNRQSELRMASASKWIFAAYVLEKTKGNLTQAQQDLLLMRGGYEDFNPAPCELRFKVSGCMDARQNSRVSKDAVGKFYYSGGNAQALAIDLGLGNFNRASLEKEITQHLGGKFKIEYPNLALAGGVRTTSADYAQFLRSILRGDYRIKDLLGKEAVCTDPKICKAALESPAKEPWLYSLHHWVEVDAGHQVQAYSSPGAFGFYPWISSDKKYYGILAREDRSKDAYWESVECGRLIRQAFLK